MGLQVETGGTMEHGAVLDPEEAAEAASDQMTVRAEVQGARVRVVVRGEVDVATASALGTFVRDAMSPGITEQVVDLAEVTFLDSSGVRVLVLASREAAAKGVAFSLLCPKVNSVVSRVLDILHIGSMMTVNGTSGQPG